MPSRAKRTPPPRRPAAGGAGRILVLLLFLVATFALVAGRLTWLQTAEAGEFSRRAEQQRTQEIVLTPRRGAILDREGQPLAISADAKTVFAMRQSVADPKATAAILAKYLGGAESAYLAKLSKKRGFVYIERKVPMDRAVPLQKALAAAKMQGVGFADDSRRVYPCGDLACQILGFVGRGRPGTRGPRALLQRRARRQARTSDRGARRVRRPDTRAACRSPRTRSTAAT